MNFAYILGLLAFAVCCSSVLSCVTDGTAACSGVNSGGRADQAGVCSSQFWVCFQGRPLFCSACPNGVWNSDLNSCQPFCASTTARPTTPPTTTVPLTTYVLCMPSANGTASFGQGSAPVLIDSPGYPTGGNYQNNANCAFYIMTSVNTQVMSLRMAIEYNYDFLIIQNIYTGVSSRYTGNQAVRQVLGSGLYMFQFTSDSSNTGSGFSLMMSQTSSTPGIPSSQTTTTSTVTHTTPPPPSSTTSTAPPPSTTSANGNTVNICSVTSINLASSGSFSLVSPNYPGSYSNSLQCRLQVIGSAGSVIFVRTVHFQTETSYDYLQITNANGTSLGMFTGNGNGPNLSSSSSPINFLFHTDASVTSTGFMLQISQSRPIATTTAASSRTTSSGSAYPVIPCQSPHQTITLQSFSEGYQINSPNWPNPYTNNLNCGWNVVNSNPSSSSKIVVQIANFTTEYCCDRLTINGGNISQSLAGSNPVSSPIFLPNIGNVAYNFNFATDGSVSYAGFRAFLYLG